MYYNQSWAAKGNNYRNATTVCTNNATCSRKHLTKRTTAMNCWCLLPDALKNISIWK